MRYYQLKYGVKIANRTCLRFYFTIVISPNTTQKCTQNAYCTIFLVQPIILIICDVAITGHVGTQKLMFCIIIESNSLFFFCSVHQHGDDDVRWKPPIGHFQKYHNTLYLSFKILHKHCFYFFLGLTMVSRETGNKSKFWRDKQSIMIFLKVVHSDEPLI